MPNVAQQVRELKQRHPEQFCADPRCLWRVVSGRTGAVTPCPKHPVPGAPVCPLCLTPLADRGDGPECPGCVEKARGE